MILLLHILLYIEESQQFKLQFLPFSSSRLKFYLLTENLSLEALQNAYIYCFVVVQSPSHVWLFVTAWTAAGLKLNSSPSTNCSLFPSLFQPFLPFSSFLLSLLKWIIYAAVKKKITINTKWFLSSNCSPQLFVYPPTNFQCRQYIYMSTVHFWHRWWYVHAILHLAFLI